MPLIVLDTFIKAPQQRVFDLSLSVNLHKDSMHHHAEKIVDGVNEGLMKKGDTVTWQAHHLLKTRRLTVTITQLERPHFFADEMLEGDFKTMRHEHFFKPVSDGTLMRDNFYFKSPFGIFGNFANALFLKNYMARLLRQRNTEIKRVAESDLWKQYLNETT